jgi:hypothetical protein
VKINYKKYWMNERMVNLYIITAVIVFSCSLVIAQLRTAFRDINISAKTKIYLKGVIVNPAALEYASEINIKKKKYDEAIIDLNLAKTLYILSNKDVSSIDNRIHEVEKIIAEAE